MALNKTWLEICIRPLTLTSVDRFKLLRRLWQSFGGARGVRGWKQGYKFLSKLHGDYHSCSGIELPSLTMAKPRVSDFVTFVNSGYYDEYYGLGDLNVDIFPHCAGGGKPSVSLSAWFCFDKDSFKVSDNCSLAVSSCRWWLERSVDSHL